MRFEAAFFVFMALAAGAAAAVPACSSDPCGDLQVDAEACADPVVKDLGLRIADAGVKNDCRLYRDAWYVTYLPRCEAYSDGGTTDAGLRDAGAPVDGGAPDAGALDAGTTDAEANDAAAPDAATDAAGTTDSGLDDTGVPDAGTDDGGTSDAGADV